MYMRMVARQPREQLPHESQGEGGEVGEGGLRPRETERRKELGRTEMRRNTTGQNAFKIMNSYLNSLRLS